MGTRDLVDPELLPWLDAYPSTDLRTENLAEHRQALSKAMQIELPPGVSVTRVLAPSIAGGPDVPLFVYQPVEARSSRPGLIHIHGGGFVLGGAVDWGAECGLLALEQNIVVASVDYRLAPETPFPGPLEDCYAALSWLHGAAEELAVDPRRIAIYGDSAGGGLAAALALAARDRGGPPICAQFLTCPMLDHRTGSPLSPYRNPIAGEFVWTPAHNRFGWRAMMGGADDPSPDHTCSPARAESLAGLPPTFMAVGALDLFIDENIDYGRRLAAAGVPIELHIYPGAYHGFHVVPGARITERYQRDYREAMARAFFDAPAG